MYMKILDTLQRAEPHWLLDPTIVSDYNGYRGDDHIPEPIPHYYFNFIKQNKEENIY